MLLSQRTACGPQWSELQGQDREAGEPEPAQVTIGPGCHAQDFRLYLEVGSKERASNGRITWSPLLEGYQRRIS